MLVVARRNLIVTTGLNFDGRCHAGRACLAITANTILAEKLGRASEVRALEDEGEFITEWAIGGHIADSHAARLVCIEKMK